MKCIEIIGNIGRNAECVTTADGREKMRFSVAVTIAKDKTLWFGVLARLQDKLLPYLVKGRQVFIRGDFDVKCYNGETEISVFPERIELVGKTEQAETAVAPTPQDSSTIEAQSIGEEDETF